jgi:transcriptional regulator with XRE-family HTH domain
MRGSFRAAMNKQAMGREEDLTWGGAPRDFPTFGELLQTFRRARRLRQVDLGRRLYLDHSTISRLEGGERLPTVQELDRIASALHLSDRERERLTAAFERDAREQLKLDSDVLLHSDECLFVAEGQLTDARRLRLLGRPQLAAAIAGRTAAWLRLMSHRSSRQATQDAILRALGDVLVEQCKSHLDYVLPPEAGDVLSKSLAEQRRIVRHLSDRRLDLLERMNREGTLYLLGNHTAAYELSRTFAEDASADPVWQPELLRAAAINAGYVADRDGLHDTEVSIERVVAERADLTDIDRAFMLEGLARGQAMIGESGAMATIGRAESLMDSSRTTSDYSAFRWVQVVRSKLRTLAALRVRPSRDIEEAAQDALVTAERLGYPRHRGEIASLLETSR